jgi:phosphatidylserine decarboxylase
MLDPMKHSGKATRAALRLIYWSLFFVLALMLAGVLAKALGGIVLALAGAIAGLWVLFGLFCFYFFRDPQPRVPATPNIFLAPAYGRVDLIDEIDEPNFIQGRCRRISMFLSVFDVHVQYAPSAGRIAFLKHTSGRFLNAMRTDCADHNEQVLIGLDPAPNGPADKVAIRLIAGLIARRIVPWVQPGDPVAQGDRISLIQFGSRCDLLLPLSAKINVSIGQHVTGGETVMALRP